MAQKKTPTSHSTENIREYKNNCCSDFLEGGDSHLPISLYCSCYNLSRINTFIFLSLLACVVIKSKFKTVSVQRQF